MRKADRLFQLVNLLRLRQPVTAQALAQEMALSVRTIYRYIDDLSVSGVPVYGEPGVGYRLDAAFELKPLTLTQDELNALLLGMQMVAVSTGTRLPAASRTLLSKIEASLPESLERDPASAAQAIGLNDRRVIAQYWDQLQDAIADRHPVCFHYCTADNVVSVREVWPLGLFYWGGKWTLGAWCLLRRDFREFRLDRITRLQTLNETFQSDETINLQHFMRQQQSAWDEKRRNATDRGVSGVSS